MRMLLLLYRKLIRFLNLPDGEKNFMLNLNYSGGPSKKCRVWILFIYTVCQYFRVVRDTMMSMRQSSWVFSSSFCSGSECCIWNLEVWWYSLCLAVFCCLLGALREYFGYSVILSWWFEIPQGAYWHESWHSGYFRHVWNHHAHLILRASWVPGRFVFSSEIGICQ